MNIYRTVFIVLSTFQLHTANTIDASSSQNQVDLIGSRSRSKRSSRTEDFVAIIELMKEKGNLSFRPSQMLNFLNGFEAIREKTNELDGKITNLKNSILQALNSSTPNPNTTHNVKSDSCWSTCFEMTHSPAMRNHHADPPGVNGRILSPNHPGNYSHNLNITWNIVAPFGHKIRITLEWLSLEIGRNSSCPFDVLQVMEADTVNGNLLLERCGQQYSPSGIVSASNILKVWFKTDHSNAFTGFSLYYESYFSQPPDLVHNIRFYPTDEFKGGTFLSVNITIDVCHNLPYPYSNNVRSVATGNRCIKLYVGSNCYGRYVRLYPGGLVARNKLVSPIRDNAESFSSCVYDEPESYLEA